MAEFDTGIHKFEQEQCRQLLSALAGVYAAGVRTVEDELVEIHVLASTERSPKQISRDVQSVLFAAYGIEVDHRIISIAQLPNDPFLTQNKQLDEDPDVLRADSDGIRQIRPLFCGIDFSSKNGYYEVSVHLSLNDRIYNGSARCRDTAFQRYRAAAQATLNAIHAMLDNDYFTILDVKPISIWDVTIMISVIEYQEWNSLHPILLTGTAIQRDSDAASIVRSTLDALNRCISKLYLPQPDVI